MGEPDERLADRRALLHVSLGTASSLDSTGENFTRGNLHNSPEAVRNGSGGESDSYTSAGTSSAFPSMVFVHSAENR